MILTILLTTSHPEQTRVLVIEVFNFVSDRSWLTDPSLLTLVTKNLISLSRAGAGVMLSEGPSLNLRQNRASYCRSHARRTENMYLEKLLLNVQFPQVADDVSCNNYYQNYKQSKFPAACLSHPVRSSLKGHFD